MDNDKAFCIRCSREVDSNTHMNCTLTFDDLLDLEERDGIENFQQNQVESAVQPQHAMISCELRRGNQDNIPGKRKSDVVHEASIQTPTKIFTSKRNSTSPRILDHNPGVQRLQNTEHGNCTSPYGTENFQPNQVKSAVQLQADSSYELAKINQNNNSGEREPDFDPEATISPEAFQSPTKIFTSKSNSTSPRILGAHNPGVQRPQNTEYENSGIWNYTSPQILDHNPGVQRLQNTEHGNCTSSYGTENCQPNQVESAVELQQVDNSCELPRINQDNNSGERKPDFDPEAALNPEAIQSPTKIFTSKINSTSPRILGVHNPGIQRPQNIEYGDCTSLPKDNYELHYDPSEASNTKMFPSKNLLTYPAFHEPTKNIHRVEQKSFVNGRQKASEFQNANPQSHERNKLDQGLIFENNTFELGNSVDFRAALPTPFLMNALGYMANDVHINQPRLQNRYASYEPHPRMMNLANNTNVKYYPENLNRLPSVSKHKVDSNYAMRDNMTVNKGIDLLGQNKLPSIDLVSKTETKNTSSAECSTSSHINLLMSYVQNMEQKSPERIKFQEYPENSVSLKNVVRNTYKSFQQKQVEQNAQQKNLVESATHKDTVESATHKDTVESATHKDTVESATQRDIVESATQRNVVESETHRNIVESATQKNAVESATQKNAVESATQKNAVESATQKNTVESATQKNTVESATQKNTVESETQKNTVESATQKDLNLENVVNIAEQENNKKVVQEENLNVFTGKGYDSIEDFIKALNDGSLYKRY